MRLLALGAQGFGTLRGKFHLDLADLAGLVAITGANGAAKTTALELWPASMFRSFPSRGKIAKLAKTRDASIWSKIDTGAGVWTITQFVDAVTGKGNTTVIDAEHKPVLSSAGLREFDAWAAKNLPTEKVFLGAQFTAQESKSLLGLTAGERKGLVLRVLRIDRYERLAKACSESAAAEEAKTSVLRATIARRRAGVRPLEAIDGELSRIEGDLAKHVAALAALADKITVLTAAAETAREALRVHEAAVTARSVAVSAHAAIGVSLADVRRRLENNRGLSADGERIRAAVLRVDALKAEIATIQGEERARGPVRFAEVRESDALRVTIRGCSAEYEKVRAACDALEKDLPKAQAAAETAAKLAAMQEAVSKGERDLEEERGKLEALQAKRLIGAEGRIENLREGLRSIAWDADQDDAKVAADVLRTDDAAVLLAGTLPRELEQQKADVSVAQAAVGLASRAYRDARSVVDGARKVADVEESIRLAKDQQAAITTERQAAETKMAELGARVAEAETAAVANRSRGEALQRDLEEVQKTAALASRLDVAVERIGELEERERELVANEAEAFAKIPEAPTPPPTSSAFMDRGFAETEHRSAIEDEKRIRASATRLTVERETAAKWWEADAEDSAKLAVLEEEIADWSHLAADFGRKGLQALEIDAAGPSLTATTNDLLRACFGPRWCVSFETVKVNGAGDESEGFAINVIDQVTGFEGDASEVSGGEKVIIAEAIALAFTALDCERSGVVHPTLVRDESGAALSPEMATAYIAMLRRALEIIGARTILFVSHNPATWALADARVEMANGAIAGIT